MIDLAEIGNRVEDSNFSRGGKLRSRCPHCHRRSFSATEIEDRILFHCFAGCPNQEICTALGIKPSDLFFRASHLKRQFGSPEKNRLQVVTGSPYQRAKILREYAHKLLDIADAYDHHSREVLDRAQELKIDDWTKEALDQALAIVHRAQKKQEIVSALDDLAYDLKTCAMEGEKGTHAARP